MTLYAHGVLQGMIVYGACRLLGLPPHVALLPAIALSLPGTFPDVDSLTETIEGNWTGRYVKSHDHNYWPWKWGLRALTWLHIEIDKAGHKADGGWSAGMYAAEALVWIIFTLVLIL